MTLGIKRLDWDSDFFGFGVGRLSQSIASRSSLAQLLNKAAEEKIRLLYGQCNFDDDKNHAIAINLGGRYVDAKRIYSISLLDSGWKSDNTPVVYAKNSICSLRQLRPLAWQSAQFSRYRLDPDMPFGSWRRLYSAYIKNSLNGQIADAVLIEYEPGDTEERIIGMISVSYADQIAKIGLLSVDERWRGKGVARRMLRATESLCRSLGCIQINVTTQGANLPACLTYESAGYSIVDEQHIFHFWLE